MLGLRFCARAFSSCGEQGPLFIAVRWPLTVAASLVAEHRLQMCRLSSCGSRAQLLRGMWDLPRPGLEPMSPALVGRFSTTVPPGKPAFYFLVFINFFWPYHMACRVLVPQPRIEPGPSAKKVWSPNHWTAREFPSTPVVEETILSPLCIIGNLVEDKLTIYAWVDFGLPSQYVFLYTSTILF